MRCATDQADHRLVFATAVAQDPNFFIFFFPMNNGVAQGCVYQVGIAVSYGEESELVFRLARSAKNSFHRDNLQFDRAFVEVYQDYDNDRSWIVHTYVPVGFQPLDHHWILFIPASVSLTFSLKIETRYFCNYQLENVALFSW